MKRWQQYCCGKIRILCRQTHPAKEWDTKRMRYGHQIHRIQMKHHFSFGACVSTANAVQPKQTKHHRGTCQCEEKCHRTHATYTIVTPPKSLATPSQNHTTQRSQKYAIGQRVLRSSKNKGLTQPYWHPVCQDAQTHTVQYNVHSIRIHEFRLGIL